MLNRSFILITIICGIAIIVVYIACSPSLYESTEGIEYQVIGNLKVFSNPNLESEPIFTLEPTEKVKSLGLFPFNWHLIIRQRDDQMGFVHKNGLKSVRLDDQTVSQISWSKRAMREQLSEDTNQSVIEKRAQMLSRAIDYTSPTVRNYALNHISHGGDRNIYQVCDLFDHLIKHWTYISDTTNVDYYANASETININLKGDCDDYAVLLVSMILAIGGGARIVSACDKHEGCHAFVELFIGTKVEEARDIHKALVQRYQLTAKGNDLFLFYKESSTNAYWLNLDWWSNHPGGKYFGKRQQTLYANGCFEVYDNNERIIAQGCTG